MTTQAKLICPLCGTHYGEAGCPHSPLGSTPPGGIRTLGAPATLEAKLSAFLGETGADELIVSMPIHDIAARLRSVELFAGLPMMEKAP